MSRKVSTPPMTLPSWSLRGAALTLTGMRTPSGRSTIMMRFAILRSSSMQARSTQFSAQPSVRKTSQHLRPTALSGATPVMSPAELLKKMMFQSRSTVNSPSPTESMMKEHSEVQGKGFSSE